MCILFNSFWGVDRPLGSSAYAVCPILIMTMNVWWLHRIYILFWLTALFLACDSAGLRFCCSQVYSNNIIVTDEGPTTINLRHRDSESCRILAWFLIWFQRFLLIFVYQIRFYILRNNILLACTKIYRNNSEGLFPGIRIT